MGYYEAGLAIVGDDPPWRDPVAYPPLDLLQITPAGEYGPRPDHPETGHKGLDFRAPPLTPCYAIRDGIIVWVMTPDECTPDSGMYGYGGNVGVYHPRQGRYTFYAHLTSISVSVWDQVRAGQSIALTGSTSGNPPKFPDMGPHLHFEVRRPGRERGNRAWPIWMRSRPFPSAYGQYTDDPVRWLDIQGFVFDANTRRGRIDPNSPAGYTQRMVAEGRPPSVNRPLSTPDGSPTVSPPVRSRSIGGVLVVAAILAGGIALAASRS